MKRLKIKFSDGSSQEFTYKGELVGFEISGDSFIVHEVKEGISEIKTWNKSLTAEEIKYQHQQDLLQSGIKVGKVEINPPTMLGTWLTSEQFTVEIYGLRESHWLGRCKDCGEGKDKLIYDLDGNPVNYPEFGKLMNRLDMSEGFRSK